MRDTLEMGAHFAGQVARMGWYLGLSRAIDRQSRDAGLASHYKPVRPTQKMQDLLADLGKLLMEDAQAVRDGVYPRMPEAADSPGHFIGRVRAMIADVPTALARRAAEDTASVDAVAASLEASKTGDLPDYYTQDFHFQTGGYLTKESARLYDVQVETLFMGAAGPMRRRVLAAIADSVRGRDQRQLALLDVACGTGRFLRQARLAFPRLQLSGLDLSAAYLEEAEHSFSGLKAANWIRANAENIPLADGSLGIVTSIFMFHELPPEVRRRVAREMARVLKPGGRVVFMDSLQMGDKPGWDGLLEAFPVRFHEPYFRHYAVDDLDELFNAAGLAQVTTTTPFLAKLMVRRKV